MVTSKALRAGSYAALLMLFMWPSIYNGQPIFSPDTPAYVRGFDAAVVWLTGRTSAWTTWAATLRAQPQKAERSAADESKSFESPTFIMAGRSVSYGALLYFGELFGGMWASVAVQAALVLAAVGLTLRHFNFFSLPKLVVTGAVLGLGSSLPFFVSFLLPDVFAGLAILAAANLLAFGDSLTGWERVFWLSILAAAVVFHPSHLAIVLVLLGVAIIVSLLKTKISLSGVVALTLVAGIGFASEFIFGFAVEKILGAQVSRPPLIMARLIGDGPGATYLRDKCPQADLDVCKYVGRLLSGSDQFLWADFGVYAPAPISERHMLEDEQYRFVSAVFVYRPLSVIAAAAADTFEQLKMIGLLSFDQTPEQALPGLPRAHAEQLVTTRLWRKSFPTETFSRLTVSVAILSLIFVAVTFIRQWNTVSTALKIFCFVILLGQISNAAICGFLSGPHERYQARLIWLIPVTALLLYYERRQREFARTSLLRWASLDAAYRLVPIFMAAKSLSAAVPSDAEPVLDHAIEGIAPRSGRTFAARQRPQTRTN